MNFVIDLLELLEYDIVMTINIVEFVSKRAYFILTYTTVTTEGISRLFLHHV